MQQERFRHYTPNSKAFMNTVTLVTGASDGLGKALALRLAELKGTVILLGRTVSKLEAVYDEIESNGHAMPAIYPLDLSGANVDDYTQMANAIESEFGKLNAVVHCAASLGALMPLSHYPANEWLNCLQTNLTGPLFLTQACLPLLEKNECASIVFTTDAKSKAYWGAYGVSKSGILSAMKILAEELEYKNNSASTRVFNVNAVIPGPMRTHLRRTAFPGENVQAVPAPNQYVNNILHLLDPTTEKPNGDIFELEETT